MKNLQPAQFVIKLTLRMQKNFRRGDLNGQQSFVQCSVRLIRPQRERWRQG